MILPAQIAEPQGEREGNQDQEDFSRTPVLGLLFIIEEVFEI